MKKRNVGVMAVLVIGAMLVSAAIAYAESLRWNASETWTDNSAISAADKATMTYYVRINKSNPRDTTGTGGWFYLGETRNGGVSYPADNSLGSLMRSYGFEGTAVNFTVSAAFKDTDGVERDSVPSPPYAWLVPPVQLEVVSMPTYSPVAGNYAAAQSVILSTSTAGASIRYTTDLSIPSATVGTLYAGPIAVGVGTTTIKAVAYKTGMAESTQNIGTYVVTLPFQPRTPKAPAAPVVR